MLKNLSILSLFIGFAGLVSAMMGWLLFGWGSTVLGVLALLGLVVLGMVMVALGLFGLMQKPRPVQSGSVEGALEAVTPQRLRGLMGKGGGINWLDRQVSSTDSLQAQPHLLIRGPMRVGKTREAVELIRRAVDRGLVKKNRVYQPQPAFRIVDVDLLKRELERLADSLEPLLLFLDDLPLHFSGELLDRASLAIDRLAGSCELFVVATARPEHLGDQYEAWLRRHAFAILDLPPLTVEGQGRLIDSATGVFSLQVSENARSLLLEYGDGTPELPIIKLRRLASEGMVQIDRKLAAEVAAQGLVESWKGVRQQISRQNEGARTILDALATFHAGGVTPYHSLLMDYARILSGGGNGSNGSGGGGLDSGVAYLQNFDVIVDRDRFFYPSLIAENQVDQQAARKNLIAFVKREIQQATRRANGSPAPERKYLDIALFDLTHTATDPEEKLELFSQTLNGSPHFGFFHDRGLLYFEKKDYEKAIADFNETLRLKPDHTSALYHRGTALALTGQAERSLKDIDQAIRLRPKFAPAYIRRGNIYFKNADFERALQDYDTAIDLEPGNTRLRYQRGLALVELSRFERALEDFDAVLEQEPDSPSVRRRRAEAYLKVGTFEAAIADFDAVILQQPEEPEPYFLRALAHSETGDNEMALADLNRALSLQPDHARALHMRGQAYFACGRLDLAIDDYEQANRLQPVEARSFYELGCAYAVKGELEKAISCYGEAIRLQPDFINAFYDRGTAYYKQGDFAKTIADLDAVVRLRPDDPSVFNNRGLAFCKQGDYARAVQDFCQAIEMHPEDAALYQNRGRAYLQSGDFVRAIEDFEEAIRLNPEDASAYAVRAQIYANRGDYRRAVPDYDAALRLKPRDAALWVSRGQAFAELGRLDEAIADYEQALKIQPENEAAYHKRGQVCARLGDQAAAIENFDRAIQLDPDNAASLVARGKAHLLNQTPKKALDDFSRAVQIDPANNWALFLQGLAFLKTGQVAQGKMSLQMALQFAEETFSADPQKWWNTFNYGLYLLAMGKAQKARGIYIDVLAKEPPKHITRGAIQDVENLASLFPEEQAFSLVRDMMRRHA